MPLGEIVRIVTLALAAVVGLWTLGPQTLAVVDYYGLPTIGYIADAILTIAPQSSPLTDFISVQPPMPAPRTPVVLKTVFINQGGSAKSTLIAPTITGAHSDRWTKTDGDFSHSFLPILEWTSSICKVPGRILLCLRWLFDHFLVRVSLVMAPITIWQLTKLRSRKDIEHLIALHEMAMAGKERDISALAVTKNEGIASLEAQMNAERSRLEQAGTELAAKTSVEDRLRSELARLNSNLTDRDNEIAELDDKLAVADKRADSAGELCETLEKKAKKSRSDFDSALMKKENEVKKHKGDYEQATKDRDSTRKELREARTEATRTAKRVTELQKQVTDCESKASELQTQSKQKDASLIQKDGVMKKIREERDRALRNARDSKVKNEKRIQELEGQVAAANKLRKDAEAKAIAQKSLAAEAIEQRKAVERDILEYRRWATEELESKEERIESLKQDKNSSCFYIQRLLDRAQALNDTLQETLDKERADAQETATKARETEDALQKRVTDMEKQLRERIASTHIPASSSNASPSSSPRLHPVALLPGGRRSRFVPPPNGTTNTPPVERGLPANTPTGPKGSRGGSRGGRGSSRGGHS